MTKTQYDHWFDFATRMARTYARRSPAFQKELEARVGSFIDVYTNGGRDVAAVESWDDGENDNGYVCDYLSECEADMACQGGAPPVYGERGDRDVPTAAYERWRERYIDPLACCVRAGLDMAAEPSMGVVGFTVGDLRRMYPDGFPAWLLTAASDEGKALLTSGASATGVWL